MVVGFVKENRPSAITPAERLDVLLVQAHERYVRQRDRKRGERDHRKKNITHHVAEVLRRDLNVVGEIWNKFVKSRSVSERVALTGNRCEKKGNIPKTR